jgi:hypothetical protein
VAAKKRPTKTRKSAKPKKQPVVKVSIPEESLTDWLETAGLTDMQVMFISHYLANNGNGLRAIMAMGHTGSNDCARAKASYFLRQAAVRTAIDDIMDGFAMSGAEALAELSSIAYMPARFELNDGRILETDPRNVKNKVTALQTVLKYHGLLKENVKLDIDLTKLSDEKLQQLRTSLGGGSRDRGAETTTTEGDGENH